MLECLAIFLTLWVDLMCAGLGGGDDGSGGSRRIKEAGYPLGPPKAGVKGSAAPSIVMNVPSVTNLSTDLVI